MGIIKKITRKISGKDKIWETNNESEQLINSNAQTVCVLIELNNNDAIESELRDLKMKLESLASSPNDEIKKIDKKIKNALDDLKIALIKSKDENDTKKVYACLQDVNVLIAQRRASL